VEQPVAAPEPAVAAVAPAHIVETRAYDPGGRLALALGVALCIWLLIVTITVFAAAR